MSTCCQTTLADVPEATVCGTCAETLVRCTRCDALTASRAGCCTKCVALLAIIETGLSFAPGIKAAARIRVENRAGTPVYIDRVRWRAGASGIAGEREIRRTFEPGDGPLVLAGDLETSGVARVSLSVSVLGGSSDLDLFDLVSGEVVVGSVREAAVQPAVHVHGSIHVSAEYGGLARVDLGDLRGPAPAPDAPPTDVEVALVEHEPRPTASDTPIVDRRTRVLWLDAKGGTYRPHFFARRPWLAMGRYRKAATPSRPSEVVDLCWLPPEPRVSLTERHIKEVSRLHGRLFVRDGALFLVDLGTPNGIHVNRRALAAHVPHVVRHGDTFAPWRDAEAPRYAGLGGWTALFRAGDDGRARSVEFRYRSD